MQIIKKTTDWRKPQIDVLFVFRSSLLNTYNLMLTHNYLLPHYISYLQLFTLTLNYIFSLNIVEAIDYDSAFTTQLPAKLDEYSKFRSTSVLRIVSALKTWYANYTSKLSSFLRGLRKSWGFREIKKNPRVMYIAGGQITPHSRITLSFLYNSRRITCNCFGLNQVTHINPLPSSLARCQRPSKLFTMNK